MLVNYTRGGIFDKVFTVYIVLYTDEKYFKKRLWKYSHYFWLFPHIIIL